MIDIHTAAVFNQPFIGGQVWSKPHQQPSMNSTSRQLSSNVLRQQRDVYVNPCRSRCLRVSAQIKLCQNDFHLLAICLAASKPNGAVGSGQQWQSSDGPEQRCGMWRDGFPPLPDSPARPSRQIVTDNIFDVPAVGDNACPVHPFRGIGGTVFLVKPLVVDSIGITCQGQRPVRPVLQRHRPDFDEVSDQIGLGQGRNRPDDFIQIGKGDLFPFNLYKLFCHGTLHSSFPAPGMSPAKLACRSRLVSVYSR